MLGGRLSADAVEECLRTGDARALAMARKRFMKLHGRVFFILGMMQYFWYRNDRLREPFVSICKDPDVQRLTWEAYMNKELVRADPMAHVRIFFKDLAHLLQARLAMMDSLAADRWTLVAVATAIVALVALLGGLATEIGEWYEGLNFPSWRPPNWLFGPAWTLIFLLTATSGVLAWEQAPDDGARVRLLALFAINAVLNIAWSPLFFKLRRPDWALVELVFLWLSVLSLVVAVGAISTSAAALLLPYLAWVSFAGFLNWRMVELNKPFATYWPRAKRPAERA